MTARPNIETGGGLKKTSEKSASDDVNLLLDRFTDPSARKRKIAQKEKQQEVKDSKFESGKKYAQDCFNLPPCNEERELWQHYVLPQALTRDELQKRLADSGVDQIGYERLRNTKGMFCIMDFFLCAEHTGLWLRARQEEIGWMHNMTLYEPLAVSHSTEELLAATLECYRMMLKQMMWMR